MLLTVNGPTRTTSLSTGVLLSSSGVFSSSSGATAARNLTTLPASVISRTISYHKRSSSTIDGSARAAAKRRRNSARSSPSVGIPYCVVSTDCCSTVAASPATWRVTPNSSPRLPSLSVNSAVDSAMRCLVLVPLPVERVAARFGGVAARQRFLRLPLDALQLGAEALLAFLSELSFLVAQPLHSLPQIASRTRDGAAAARCRLAAPAGCAGPVAAAAGQRWTQPSTATRSPARRRESRRVIARDDAHDRPPCGAGTGTMMRSGRSLLFGDAQAPLRSRAAISGSATNSLRSLSQ